MLVSHSYVKLPEGMLNPLRGAEGDATYDASKSDEKKMHQMEVS